MKPETLTKKIIFRSNLKEVNLLLHAAKKASIKAIRENKAMGLSFLYTKNNQLVRENPDGKIEIVTKNNKILNSTLKIKKGSILYAKS